MKNKKILLLLCIPIIISVLVLPLCSFTNINSSDYYSWESLHDISVGYDYVYNGVHTRGTIERYNRVFASGAFEEFNFNNVVFDASGYNILGSPSLKINYIKGNSTYSSSNNVLRLNMVTNGGNSERSLSFDGRITLRGYMTHDNLKNYSLEFPNIVTPSGGYRCDIDVEYLYVESNSVWADIHSITLLVTPNLGSISLQSLYDDALSKLNQDGISPLYITGLLCKFFEHDGFGNFGQVSTNSVTVSAPIMPSFSKSAIQLDVIRDYFYGVGYVDGENHGLSTAPQVWGSISDFLENTIGGFLDFEFVDGVTFGGLISVFLGFILVFAFLKIFAGG